MIEARKIVERIDVKSPVPRTTEFVPLEFAQSEQVREALSVFYGQLALGAQTPGSRTVSIVADPATNSLVISADQTEWPGIRELLEKLDAKEYDSSR